MVYQKPRAGQADLPTTRQVNVTGMTPNQRRELFKNYLNQDGFTGFIKHSENKQTYYTFKYQNL